ncbi:MAG: hypothetical protein JRI23_06115 [Deltaproteobacteria bacterium]|nr:hypothetical protein [Deltaproteobacteria bacterium]MBW2531146.1 hypothetical protein [Deltaproteobacteria bacterium]
MSEWRTKGLVDAATYDRLRWYYAARQPLALDAADAWHGASDAVRDADSTQGVDGLERDLDDEVQLHFDFERRAAAEKAEREQERALAAAHPPAEREGDVGNAAVEAVADVLAVDRAAPEPRSLEEAVIERESRWAATLRPFLHENALWMAGGLLTVAGSLYFLGLAWDRLDSAMLHFAIAVVLHLYAAAFFGVGWTLIRRRQAHTVGRILFGFSVLLLPLANLAVGELGAVLMQGSALQGALLGGGVLLVTLIGQGIMLAVIGGLYERRSMAPLVQTGLALALLTALVAPLATLAVPAGVFVAVIALAFVALTAGCLAGAERLSLRMSALLLGGGGLWALGVLVARAQLVASFELTHYASLVVLVAALFIAVDHRLRARAGHAPRLTALGMGLHGATLFAVALSVAGLVHLGYFDLSARLTVLATAATAALVLARAAWHHGRSAMTYLAAGVGLLAYFFLPAPFLRLMQLVHQWASGALGYAGEPLPVAYYGLTFIPYVLLLAWGARRLQGRRPDLSRDLVRFLCGLGGLLMVLALTSTADLRPMLWTWPIYAVGGWVGARLFRVPRLIYAGHGLLIAFVCAVGVWAARQGHPLAPTMLLAVCAALVAAWVALDGRAPQHLVHGALAALGIAPVAGILGGLSAETLAVAQGFAALALLLLVERTRSAAAAIFAGLLAFGAAATFCVALELSLAASAVVLIEVGTVGAVATFFLRQAPSGSRRSSALASGALAGAALALGSGWALGLLGGSTWTPLVAAAGMIVLALLSRGAALTPIAAVAWVVAAAAGSADFVPAAWPLVLSVLSCGLLVLAAAVPWSWSAARGRALSLLVVSASVLLVALCALWWRALPGQPDASWWGFAANSSVLAFALTAALLERARRPDLAAGLLALVALFGALAASFALEALVDLPTASRPWVHGALLGAMSLGWSMIADRLRLERLGRAARWVAAVAPLLPLTLVVVAAVGSALAGEQLVATSAAATSSWLEGSAWSVTCAALTLVALRRAAELRVRPVGWHLSVVALIGLVLLAASTLLGGANLAIATALLALGVGVAAAYRATLFGRPIPVAWALGIVALALVATHFDVTDVALPIVLGCLSAILFAAWLRRHPEASRALAVGWSLALSVTLQVTMVWLAFHLSTGRYSATAAMALLGPAAVAAALALRGAAKRFAQGREAGPVLRLGHGNLLVAAVLAGASVAANAAADVWFIVPSALVTLGVVIALLVAYGRTDCRAWMLHAAGVVAPVMYLVVRSQPALSATGPCLDCSLLLVASHGAFWLARSLHAREPASSGALRGVAVWWPLLAVAIAPTLSSSGIALLALLVAVHYAVLAQVARNKSLSVPAMVFGNLALFSSWATLGWSHLLAYAIPVGVTLLALIHVYSDELGRRPRKILRRVVVASLYVLSVGDALLAATPLQALVIVPLLCVAGIAIGAVTRVRIYLVMSVVFLAADLALTMLRYGLESRPLGALFLTLLGLLLIASMVMFSLDRERILRRYSTVLGELRAWD